MGYKLLCLILLMMNIQLAKAQIVALGGEMEVQAYQWQRSPSGTLARGGSSGQALSLFAVGPKIWFGDWEFWTISLEGKVGFAPLNLDADNYNGLGALTFPTLAKINFDPFGTDGIFKVGIGGGAQWSKVNLYARPKDYRGVKEPFFITYIGEISLQFVTDGSARHDWDAEGYSLEIFIRGGKGPGSGVFGMGVKFNMRGHL